LGTGQGGYIGELTIFRSEMALFRNFGVNRRNSLYGKQQYASAQCRRFPCTCGKLQISGSQNEQCNL
ncbi:MAG: hypothetical protein WAM73_13790, partial [Desulfobacterales bacterium]